MSRKPNWSDALGQNIAYVVLKKENRLQVGVHPTEKQLRRWGKRNWSLVAAIPEVGMDNHHAAPPDDLRAAVLDELKKFTANGNGESEETAKKKRRKKVRLAVEQPLGEAL